MSVFPLRSCKKEEMAWKIAAGTMSYVTGRLDVSKRTLARWKTRDDLRRRVTELRAEMTREGCGRLAENMVKTADALSYL